MAVRAGTADDLPSVAAIYTHYVLNTSTTFHTQVRTPAEWRERHRVHVAEGPYHLLVGEVDGAVVGYCETLPFRPKPAYFPSIELSIYVAPGSVGLGVGGHLLAALFEQLRDSAFHRLFSIITLPNEPSVAFHRHHGFVHRGTLTEAGRKFDQWWDVAFYEKALD
jgi:phosphinothricin acetyltransferase